MRPVFLFLLRLLAFCLRMLARPERPRNLAPPYALHAPPPAPTGARFRPLRRRSPVLPAPRWPGEWCGWGLS